MIRKLRLKFIAVNMGIVSIMLCVILGLVFHFTRASLEQENLDMMKRLAASPVRPGVLDMEESKLRLPYFVLKVGPGGEVITTAGGYYDLSDSELLHRLADRAFASSRSFGVIADYNLRYYRVNVPAGHCLVFSDISSEITTLDNLTKSCAVIGSLSFLLFLGASILLSKWAVRPVEQAWEQQKRFVADASHELKTPLTVIMTNAELARSDEYDAKEKALLLSHITAMSRQMKGLIEQLLSLARADAAEGTVKKGEVCFGKLAEQTALTFESVFFEREISLDIQIDREIQVSGDADELRQVVEILMDNAAKYTRSGGRAWMTLRKQGKNHCLLSLADEGEPISKEGLLHIFRRFYRGDQARPGTGSFGLGLSIAQAIVLQHKGKIWAESENGINTFFVLLPCRKY